MNRPVDEFETAKGDGPLQRGVILPSRRQDIYTLACLSTWNDLRGVTYSTSATLIQSYRNDENDKKGEDVSLTGKQ